MANIIDSAASLNYEVFDRQLHNFMHMLCVMIDGWDDYCAEEICFDINSLCIKASKLCFMADQDLALQHADVTHLRKLENEKHLKQLEELSKHKLYGFLLGVIDQAKQGDMLEGFELPMFAPELSNILPRLGEVLSMGGMSEQEVEKMVTGVQVLEASFDTMIPKTEIPKTEAPSDMLLVRLWNFLRLVSMTGYLVLHFRRVCHLSNQKLTPEVVSRLTEQAVQKYMKDEQHQLELYFARLQYENDGRPLSEEQWLKERRTLRTLVPENLELAFLNYASNTSQLGAAIADVVFTAGEFDALVAVLAKYQLITQRIFEIRFPEEREKSLPNEAFNLVVRGKAVDLNELKNTIAKMASMVQKKNQWFCVWSVLKHINVLRDDCNFATFAHQMMSPEWFGMSENIVHFSADNLSDYSRYFNEYDYTDWQEDMFLEKKALYGMTKWSDKLCRNFSQLCEKMLKAIWGYSFLTDQSSEIIERKELKRK